MQWKRHTGIYLLFFNGGRYFAFFHSKPNVRNSCTDGQFWCIFSVLETEFVHQILICSPCFCDFSLCSLQFPSSTGIQVPFQDIFFSYLSLSWREGGGIVPPSSRFPNTMVLDDPKKRTTGDSVFYKSCDPTEEGGSHVPTTSRPWGLRETVITGRADQTLFCCHQLLPVMVLDLLTLGRRNPSWIPEPVHHSHVLLCCWPPCVAALGSSLRLLMLCSDWVPAAELAGSVFFGKQTFPLTMGGKGRLPFNHNYSVASALPTTTRALQSLFAHWGLQCSLRCKFPPSDPSAHPSGDPEGHFWGGYVLGVLLSSGIGYRWQDKEQGGPVKCFVFAVRKVRQTTDFFVGVRSCLATKGKSSASLFSTKLLKQGVSCYSLH